MNPQWTHQAIHILNPNYPDQTRLIEWIIKKINVESALITLSCYYKIPKQDQKILLQNLNQNFTCNPSTLCPMQVWHISTSFTYDASFLKMQARYLIKVKRFLYFSTSPQRPFVDVEHSWFVEQGVNEQIDLWNTLVDVERMQANRANVRKIAHLTTFMGGG